MSGFAVTFFSDYAAKIKTEESLTLEALADRIRATTAPAKEALPWLKFARFGVIPNPKTKSGSLRWNGNVLRLSGIIADYDAEQMTSEEAAERLDKAGINAIVYTSPSHMLDGHGPRWRVGCPFAKPLPPDMHYQMLARLNGLLGGILAPESWTLSQSFYYGSVNGNPAHQAIVVDGTMTLDQCGELDRIAIGKPNGNGHARSGANPEAAIGDIIAALEVIRNPMPTWDLAQGTWDPWNTIGMAVYRASGGSEEGFAAFDAWSQKWPKKYDPDETRFRWDHFHRSPPSDIGFGTLVHLARQTTPGWMPPGRQKSLALPNIKVIAGERHLAADQGMRALVDAKVPFYQRDMKIVRVALVKAKNSSGVVFDVPGIVTVTAAMLERALGQSATWWHFNGRSKKDVIIDPPRLVASQILDMAGEWSFAPLTGIIQCPTLRRDGSLLHVEGYDETTGLMLVNSLKMPPIAANPTRDDAEAALALLNDLLIEFPFVDETSRAVALSMILTSVLRAAMEVAPMHLVTAPLPGSGKSYLADLASMISTGDRCAVKAASPRPDETEKRLIGSALAGHPIIALDNCRDILQGDFLCQLTERPLLSLRALGTSDQHRIPNTFTFFANGNNIAVADDMVRRTIRSALDANCESPEKRTFRSNPIAMIRADRSNYVAACLIIARAYIVAGRPNPLPPLPSFEQWSAVVREPLAWLGMPDPVDTMETLRNEDPKGAELHKLFDAWKSAIGVGKSRSLKTSEIIDVANNHTDLREALLAVASQRYGEGKIDSTALGKWLCAQEKNIAVGCKLMTDRTDKSRPKWYLELQGR